MVKYKRRIEMKKYDCGCIEGYYWCSKHDIYNKQNPNDLPPHGYNTEHGKIMAKEILENTELNTSCSCHISAPCSYCVGNIDN
jgi:hypothetical protein